MRTARDGPLRAVGRTPRAGPRRSRAGRAWLLASLLACLVAGTGCTIDTSRLDPAQEQRLEAEGILHRGANLRFRHTRQPGRYSARWRDMLASIVVTKQSVLVHRGREVLFEITPRSRRFLQVLRDGPRVRIRSGSGGSAESWSFTPPDDPAGWTRDIRAVIGGAAAAD